jgi:3-hydroxyacyl-CoA dehydrogenase
MSRQINRIAVIGAGTMGAGIAGLCAARGSEVVLLDMTREQAQKGVERLTQGRKPAVTEAVAATITTGSLQDELALVADCDWICEAVVEDLNIKRELFTRLEAVRADGSILSTNTSGIPLRDIYRDMPERLQRDIAVTHFFNPVHIMKLVELVPGSNTSPDVTERLTDYLDNTLEKGTVYAKDTVNFIGNRIGCFWMLAGLHKASESGLSIETVDALMSKPIGLPATGLYGLIDLIGLDVMDFVAKNLDANLPANDPGREFLKLPATELQMLADGQLGRKSGGGFYKMVKSADGEKHMEIFDLSDRAWRPMQPIQLEQSHTDFSNLMYGNDPQSAFTQALMGTTLRYASALVPEISDDVVNVDRAMKWGFNWDQGPFELLDSIDPIKFADAIKQRGEPVDGMLKVLIDSGNTRFYQAQGKEFLGTDGKYHPLTT